MKRWNLRSRDAALLLATTLAAGAIAALRPQDANWDLKNYHFYNAWAFLHGRLDVDIAPAQLQTYLSPLGDLPFYAMVAAGWPPRAIAAAMALPAGIGAFLLVKVLARLFGDLPSPERERYVAFAAVIGLTAADPIALLASTMNEWPGATLTLAALLVLLRRPDAPGVAALCAAGLLSGAAAGLKLTAATYSVGLGAALLLRRPAQRAVADAFVFGIAVLAGLAATQGFWFATLWRRFDSPVFPYFNALVRSPWWDPRPVLDPGFGPHTGWEALAFPLLLFGRTAGRVATSGFRDWRLPVLYLLAFVALASALMRRRADAPPLAPPGPVAAWRLVAVFAAVSYVVWLALHSIHRYLLPLELLSGALILGCLRVVVAEGRTLRNAAIVVVTVLLVASTRPPYFERVEFGDRYVDVRVPEVAPGAAVLLVADAPLAHVLPFFPADGRFIGVRNNLIAPGMDNRLAREVARVLREHRGPFYALGEPAGVNEDALAAHGLRRVPGSCAAVVSNLAKRPFELCRVERLAASVAP